MSRGRVETLATQACTKQLDLTAAFLHRVFELASFLDGPSQFADLKASIERSLLMTLASFQISYPFRFDTDHLARSMHI